VCLFLCAHVLLLSYPLFSQDERPNGQTTNSNANEIIEGLGFTLPNPVKENKFRASLASFSTFMTTDSAEAVIPRTPMTETSKVGAIRNQYAYVINYVSAKIGKIFDAGRKKKLASGLTTNFRQKSRVLARDLLKPSTE
jgi:hypothetical protein